MLNPTISDLERFNLRIVQSDDCWLWTAGGTSLGHGRFWVDNRTMGAHEFGYFLATGYFGPDHVHHTCPNKRCVNPAHLERLTPRDHMLVGDTFPAQQARQTHCKRGHEFNEQNTYVTKDGFRQCRVCRRKGVK